MKQVQKYMVWGVAIYLGINLTALLLSWRYFGFFDWEVLWEMALIALPPLVVVVGSYLLLSVDLGQEQRDSLNNQRPLKEDVAYGKANH